MQTTIRSRAMWLFAILLLVTALTLSACGARNGGGNNGGYSGGGQTTTQTQATPDIQDLRSADQSLQDITNSLQGISNDANTDYSSQDTPQQP
jgi:hypothetical protein